MAKSGQKNRLIAAITALVLVVGYSVVAVSMAVEASNPVKSTLSPYFSQKWNVFAPNIQKRDLYLEVRSRYYDDSNQFVESEWIPVTEIERLQNKGSLGQSRIQKLSQNVIGSYNTRYNKLNSKQRKEARSNFVTVNDGKRSAMSDDSIIERILGDRKNTSTVTRFVRMDYMLIRYATVFSEAYTGKTPKDVQWRIVGERNNDFAHRFTESKQFDISVTTFGWRPADVSAYQPAVEQLERMIAREEGR